MVQKEIPAYAPIPTLERYRRPAQPRKEYVPVDAMTEAEIRAPFHLHRKGRINSWLTNVSTELEKEERTLAHILPDYLYNLVRLYFYPQRGRWISQEEAMAQLTGDPSYGPTLEAAARQALTRVRRYIESPMEVRGDRIELLRLRFIYYEKLIAMDLTRVSAVKLQSGVFFERFCGARPQFDELTASIAAFDPSWEPPTVTFRAELPPELAFRR